MLEHVNNETLIGTVFCMGDDIVMPRYNSVDPRLSKSH